MRYIGKSPSNGTFQKLDTPSFDGVTSTFNLYTSGISVTPGSAANMIISLHGIIQEPNVSYILSGSAITFDTPPPISSTFFGVVLGVISNVGIVSDGSITAAKLAAGAAASYGANIFTGTQDFATGTAIASASTINLDTATGNRIHITGTTNINVVTLTRGPRTVIFDGVLTLNHNSTTNNLPSGSPITTAVGDRAIFESDGTTVYCVGYVRASGLPLVSSLPTYVVFATTSQLNLTYGAFN
jgi:hypothetical protein